MLAAVDKLDPGDRGVLDMTEDKITRFIPSSD